MNFQIFIFEIKKRTGYVWPLMDPDEPPIAPSETFRPWNHPVTMEGHRMPSRDNVFGVLINFNLQTNIEILEYS